jgi:hypothetical protein
MIAPYHDCPSGKGLNAMQELSLPEEYLNYSAAQKYDRVQYEFSVRIVCAECGKELKPHYTDLRWIDGRLLPCTRLIRRVTPLAPADPLLAEVAEAHDQTMRTASEQERLEDSWESEI